MKKSLLSLSLILIVGICSAQEMNAAQENNTIQKQDVGNKEELKTNTKSIQNFNTNKIQLDKVQQMKSRMQGSMLNKTESPEIKATAIEPQPAAVESKD